MSDSTDYDHDHESTLSVEEWGAPWGSPGGALKRWIRRRRADSNETDRNSDS
jgi:hypothetical protein